MSLNLNRTPRQLANDLAIFMIGVMNHYEREANELDKQAVKLQRRATDLRRIVKTLEVPIELPAFERQDGRQG